jgi:hypothetical protein
MNGTTTQYATKGNGAAIHIAHVYPGGNVATLCDKWGATGARSSRVRLIHADAATCKSCLRIAAKEVSA